MHPIVAARWDRVLAELRTHDAVAHAERALRADDEQTLADQIELSEIPAPPFHEEARARRMGELMAEAGLSRIGTDAVGNVQGWLTDGGGREMATDAAPLVVSAHLDTVFPAGTDVAVRRDGEVLRGAGISDDARGLATLLAVARALRRSGAGAGLRHPLLFVATVGEEGAGDLRGVKHLFGDAGAARHAAGFISLDGAGLERIVARGLGSRRFRVEAHGPGGHSWADWGTVNPIHALAALADRLTRIALPEEPVTTLTIARWGGGKSINAIPQLAWLELDTRSESDERLAALEGEVRRVVEACAADAAAHGPSPDGSGGGRAPNGPGRSEHRGPGDTNALTLSIRPIGLRPGGETDADSELVQAACAATRAAGRSPLLALSSTDANIPMSLGIPAITVGCGGSAGKAHTTEEWYDNTDGVAGTVRALHTVLLAARGVPAPGRR